jgi:nucleotide-binding universal stress UspA family protein
MRARTCPRGDAVTRALLIAVDLGTASEALVQTSVQIAKTMGAVPYLLYTYDFPPPSPSSFYSAASTAIHEQAKFDLRHLARACAPSIGDEQLLVRSGPAARLIVETARELDAALIVMGTHRLRGLERLLVRGTAEPVVRKSTCPVLVIPCELPVGRHAVASAS